MSVFFFIILILLCVLDFYSIANYQNERTLEMENLLSEYLVYDEFNMGSIKAELYNIYSSDVFFDELSRNYDAMSAYLDIYNLKDKYLLQRDCADCFRHKIGPAGKRNGK